MPAEKREAGQDLTAILSVQRSERKGLPNHRKSPRAEGTNPAETSFDVGGWSVSGETVDGRRCGGR